MTAIPNRGPDRGPGHSPSPGSFPSPSPALALALLSDLLGLLGRGRAGLGLEGVELLGEQAQLLLERAQLGRVLALVVRRLLSQLPRQRRARRLLHRDEAIEPRALSEARLKRVSSRTGPVWMHWSAVACGSPVLAREVCQFGVRALCGVRAA